MTLVTKENVLQPRIENTLYSQDHPVRNRHNQSLRLVHGKIPRNRTPDRGLSTASSMNAEQATTSTFPVPQNHGRVRF